MSRRSDREGFTEPTRLNLLETDLDNMDLTMAKLTGEIHASVEKLDARVSKVQTVLIGILISITTACILLVINVTAVR